MNQIVLMMTDTQRTDMLSCYGNPGMITPHLDRLAGEGIRFDRAYTCQPVCGPARSALFTGTYPHTNGSWANSLPLGANVKTLGQRVSDLGIKTAYIGKWHLDGGDYFGLGQCPDGWDAEYWYDMRCYLEELTPEERLLSRDQSVMKRGGVPEEFTFGHRVAQRALSFIEKHKNQDFLLVVSFDEPHHPFLCPGSFYDLYNGYQFPLKANRGDALEDKPEHIQVWAGNNRALDPDQIGSGLQEFFACNSFVDYEIGRLVSQIDATIPQAMVIYTSDHGDALGSHRISNKGPAIYDEVTRIPLIIRDPQSGQQKAVCPHPVSHIDLAPTILDRLGLACPKLLEGASLVPCLRQPDLRINDAVFIEFHRYEVDHDGFGGFQPSRCAFDGRYKLAINLLTTDELYDLQEDPQEMTNLLTSVKHQAIRDRLHNQILAWMNRTRDPFRGYYWERRPWRTNAVSPSWDYTGMTRQRENEEYEPRQLDYNTGLEMVEAIRPKK